MNRREYHHLRAQLDELDKLLAMTPESAVINRMSLEYRRSQVAEELETYPVPVRWPVAARLTFKGAPVVDRRGINAAFGANAVQAFATAVAFVGASQRGVLNERGPIPNRENYRLLITGTSPGSFGFEIEEVLEQEQQGRFGTDSSQVELAIEQVKSILKASVSNDDALAEAVDYTHPRALAALHHFLKIMADNQAVCSLSFKDGRFPIQ